MGVYVFFVSAQPQMHSVSIPLPGGKIGYLRVIEAPEGTTLSDALDLEPPNQERGETLLNSVELYPLYSERRK